MLRNRVNTVPSVRKIELSRENFCSGEPKLINFSTCRSSLEGCGRINQHFLSVRDRGIGIKDEFKSRIFSRFSQADAGDARQKGGTGLGLAICKELIEAMSGRIGYESREHLGSTFWFELPIASQVVKE